MIKQVLFISLLMVFVSGCSMLPGAVTCDPPYIKHGTDCCLDVNNNSICDTDEGTMQNQTTGGNQTECGNGICDSATESYYNCPEDCEEEEECVGEGGTIPVIASPPECCAGLDLIDPKEGILGISGYCTAKCGDGYCNSSIESSSNCPLDCEVMEALPADPCDAVECGSGYYCSNGTCVESMIFKTIPFATVEMYSFCGDDICSSSENSSGSCCEDCGCSSGHYCSNNTCIEGTAPLFMPMFFVVQAYFPPAEKLISDGKSSSVKPPRIHGNRIVFSEITGSMHYSPRMYDTSTGKLENISYSLSVEDPDIWGGRIVWDDSGVPGEGPEIYYYNFGEGVQGYINPRPTYQYGAKIWNNAIIWFEQVEDGSDTSHALYFFWIPSAEERKIFNDDHKDILSYDIWGGDVIIATNDWTGDGKLYELWKYDISTKKTERLFYNDDGKEIHSVSIWDEKVVYINGNGGYAHVYAYDLDTGITQKLTSVNSEKVDTAIFGDRVVWSDKRNGNYDIYMYDMSTDTETQITTDTKDDWRPDIYGDIIVWIKGRYSGTPQDVYMYKLS